MEIGSDNRISFLDVTLIVENGIITFDLYKKTYELRKIFQLSVQPSFST